MQIWNPFLNPVKKSAEHGFLLSDGEMAVIRNTVTLQMLRRLQLFTAIIFLIHIVILLFIVPGNLKVYEGERLQIYTMMNYCDLAIVIGSLILFILITAAYPKKPEGVSRFHGFIVVFTCLFLLLWASVKTGFQQAFVGQINIYLVVLLAAGGGALLSFKNSLIVFLPPFAAFVAGSFLVDKSVPLLQDNLINGSSLTVVAWVLSRILFRNFKDNLVKQRIIERQNAALRESEEKFSKSFQYNKVIMALSTIPEGRYIDVNEEFLRVAGIPKDQIIGHTAIELGLWIQPEKREKFLDDFSKEGSLKDYEMDFRHPSGKIISLIGCLMTIHLNGVPYELFSCQDITERKKAEQQLIKLNAELEDRVTNAVSELRDKDQLMFLQSRQAAMGEMLSNIAHQWRQPLNATGMIIQNIEEYYRTGHLTKEFLSDSVNRSMEQILHMSKTIDDFRNFFKPDKEKIEFNLKKAVESAISLISASCKQNFVECTMDCREEVTVSGYPNELSQAILNILNNSLDVFSEKKKENGKLAITVGRENKRPFVLIADNAGGIPSGVMPRIFDPFYTTKEQGTGIGLYMTKTIIEKNMNGRISAKNANGGAEFRIEF